MLNISITADPNYYLNAKDELDSTGHWAGKGAEMLGVEGPDVSAYKWLAKNRKPDGSKLTQRDFADRISVIDLTFSEPKSVSIMREIGGDERIAWAHEQSVYETMRDVVEPLASARAWNGITNASVTTGNLAWIPFPHRLSRPVEGVAAPNGHTHVVIPNATNRGGKWYALELKPIKDAAPIIQAAWHANFAGKLKQLGYDVRPTKDAFEIKGVLDSTIRKFSPRAEAIEREALRRKIKSPKGRAALAALTREKKRGGMTEDQLKREWSYSLDPSERQMIQGTLRMAAKGPKQASGVPTSRHVRNTLTKLLEAHSAVPGSKLLTESLREGAGEHQLADVRKEIAGLDVIRGKLKGVNYITTKEAILKEKEVLREARKGSIRLARVRRGDSYEAKEGEALLKNPTFEQIYQASKSTDSVVAVYPLRDYRKSDRGNPNVWLEDLGGLRTAQERPRGKLAERAARVGNRVMEQLRRARRYVFQQERHHAIPEREVARQDRGLAI